MVGEGAVAEGSGLRRGGRIGGAGEGQVRRDGLGCLLFRWGLGLVGWWWWGERMGEEVGEARSGGADANPMLSCVQLRLSAGDSGAGMTKTGRWGIREEGRLVGSVRWLCMERGV